MKTKRSLLLLIISIMMFGLISIGATKVFAATSALGTIKYTYSRTIMTDMTYTYTQSDDGNPQKAYVMEYNPKTTGIEAMAVFGEYYFGGDTISTNIALAKSKGYTVIAGVNASPFDTSNGVTVGTTIQNGRIVCSQTGELSDTYDNFAFCKDGTAYIGHPNFEFSYTLSNGTTKTIKYLNRQKKTANSNIYLISSDYYTDTTSAASSCEAVLSIVSGDLIVGTSIQCTVDSVKEDTTRTKVEKGKLVLVGPSLEGLGNIKAGDSLTINIKDNDSSFDWSTVQQTISGFYEILKNGQVVNSDSSDRHPRTTLGYKEDGTIVVYVCDGRQSTALGMTDAACANYMKELGCIAAIRMDGGGSSNLSLRLPGDTSLTTVNVPSDGEERHDADAFLFVLKSDYDTEVKDTLLLHAYPNDLKVLENTVVDITVKATDDLYNPKTCPSYTMTTTNDCGEIVNGNQFKARSGSGTGRIQIQSGTAKTYVNVTVSNKVDELYCTVNNLALSPKETRKLEVKAYYLDDLLECSNEAFTWTCDINIGTVDNSGLFTASDATGQTGYIYVSYGKVQAKVLVTLGQLPVEIAGFEDGETNVTKWSNTQIGQGSGTCSINTDLQYVRFGERSLKIDFNLANTTGTCGTQISRSGGVAIKGTPTAIGMWIYGTESSQGAWIRMQYSTGKKYADFGHIDWLGWKYVEAEFDESTTFPVSVTYLVRVMAVADGERLNGTIYVDGLRAVYGFTNDDTVYPVISNVSPSDNDIVRSTTTATSFDLTDTDTGINLDNTHFYLNDEEITNLQVKEIADGYNVTWTPSAYIAYKKGLNTVKVRTEDNFGNFTIKEWSFTIDSSLPEFVNSNNFAETLEYNNTYTYSISTKNTSQFKYLNIEVEFSSNVELEEVKRIGSNLVLDIKSNGNGKAIITLENTASNDTKDVCDLVFKVVGVGEVNINVTSTFTNANYESEIKAISDSFTFNALDTSLYAYMVLDEIKASITKFFDER